MLRDIKKSRNPKIAIIGAGSVVFVKNIVGDILHLDAFKECTISLMDIDSTRLSESELVLNKVAKYIKANPKIIATTDRLTALQDADFVICFFQIGRYDPATIIDFEVPKKYGLRQTIADTLGAGGLMRALRSIPVHLSIAQDMRQVCPNAIMLNYVNPMAMISWAMAEFAPDIKYVGLCHSVQGTAYELSQDLGISYYDIRYRSAGINHMAFYLNFEKVNPDGTFSDLYPELKKLYSQTDGNIPKSISKDTRCKNIVRYEIFKYVDYFVTESSEHFSEYTPWFIKNSRPDLIEKYQIPLDEYPKRCLEQIEKWTQQISEYRKTDLIKVEQSHEYAATIVNSVWTGVPSVIYGNIPNHGVIDNLLQGCSVEVPCLIDENGVQPVKIGKMPTHLASLISTNIGVQACLIEAFKKQDRKHVYHALMLDPHTSSELDLEQITNLVDEMLAEHKKHGYMPAWLYE